MQAVLEALTSGATVVTPRPDLARHLQQHVDRQQRRAGNKTWGTADALHFGAWLERCWDEASVTGGEIGELQLLPRSHAQLVWRDIIGRQSPLLNDGASAALAQRAWELAHAWHIPLDDIRRQGATEDTRMFVEWAEAYRRRCDEEGWIDLARLPVALAPRPVHNRAGILFFGFAGPSPHQQAVIERFGSVAASVAGQSAATGPRLCCPDEAQEIDLAARWLRDELRRTPDALAGIVMPTLAKNQQDIQRRVLQTLQPDWHARPATDRPIATSGGTPLSHCGPVRTALLALKLASGFMAYDELGELLRSPFLGGGVSEAGPRAMLDVSLRDRNEREIGLQALSRGDALADVPVLASLMNRALGWAGKFSGRKSPGQWARSIDQYLSQIGWCSAEEVGPDDQPALRGWQRLLEQFSTTGLVLGPVSFGDARAHLMRAAGEEVLRVSPPPHAVHLLSLADAFEFSFDAVWVAGLTSDSWPAPTRINPLIPVALQREHGLPDADPDLHHAHQAQLLQNVLASSRQVAVSWPLQQDQAIQLPHPAIGVSVDTRTEASGILATPTRRALQLAGRGTERLTEDPPPAAISGGLTPGGGKLFRFQAACPARAFFETRLGATELPVPAFGIDARTRGNFVHEALEHLYREPALAGGIATGAAEALPELIERAIARAAAACLPSRDALSGLLAAHERRRLRALLDELMACERTRGAFEVHSVEGKHRARIGPLEVSLRHDRIDRLDNAHLLVFDYKTSARFSLRDWLGSRPAEPQLPLYAVSAGADGIVIVLLNESGVRFQGVARPGSAIAGVVEPADKPFGADWESLVERWREALEALADEFVAGDCRIDLRDKKFATGEFAMLTRVGDLE